MKRRMRARFRVLLKRLLHHGDSPDRTALAYAAGVFVAFSPLFGLHTILGLTLAFAFRLNRLAVLIGVYSNTPWTIAPAASIGTGLGLLFLGRNFQLPVLPQESMFSRVFWSQLTSGVDHLLLPFFLGNMFLAGCIALVSYYLLRRGLLNYKARRARRQDRPATTSGAP